MANPFLPLWEYIPDGEPRVFGDRVYIYGSHDRPDSDAFCDYKLKVWSAPISDLNKWECHGDSFHTMDDRDHKADTDWTNKELYAPDVVEKDGKYYLYAYILHSKGCVGVSDYPEGPFKLLSQYKYNEEDAGDEGVFNDVGVLVDDDGRVYAYYGFEHSFMNEINPDNMYEIIEGSLKENVLPEEPPYRFFEASSPRKIGDTYYLIFSPKPPEGQRLAYATSDSPTGPFTYRGYIVDNGDQYPAGNNHGSICCINGQWYVFYHRMTNNTILSRRACVEKINILPDGTIPTVEMTSLGFEEYLSPYKINEAEIACVLMGGCYVTEKDFFTRPITNIKHGAIIGYKYFEFGNDYSSKTMKFFAKAIGSGGKARIRILLDDYENGEEIGVCDIDTHDGVYSATVKSVTGRHAVFFVIEHRYGGWFVDSFAEKPLFELVSFSFAK
ncbi:MAG: family 43 glycosylhydrolase [Lachnospiraceae bacterium]|nr:family 43 glycosylhydrolase [Lachnospiraceae bacterium]MBR3684051.1 family 43 glycosylhydrolase [Lachnospiraceae bacterium]